MKINRTNYESFFLDYIEGNLNSEELEELKSFLLLNNDLEDELFAFKNVSLPLEEVSFSNKEILKKLELTPVNESNFEALCIAKFEGDLTEIESKKFDEFLMLYPKYQVIYLEYSKVFLKPIKSDIYFNKEYLKISKNRTLWTTLRYAASIVFIVSLSVLLREANLKVKEPLGLGLKQHINIQNSTYSKIAENKSIVGVSKIRVNEKIVRTMTSLSQVVQPTKRNEPKFSKLMPKTNSELIKTKCLGAIKQSEFSNLNSILKNKQLEDNIAQSHTTIVWEIAELGVKQINKLTGSNLQLNRKIDPIRKKEIIEFDSYLLSYTSEKKIN